MKYNTRWSLGPNINTRLKIKIKMKINRKFGEIFNCENIHEIFSYVTTHDGH